jgi:hypothetical protein
MKGSIKKSLLLLFAIIGLCCNLKAQCPLLIDASIPKICNGVTSTIMTVSISGPSADQYRIDWNATANSMGLADKLLTSFVGNTIAVNGIPNVIQQYSYVFQGMLYVKNNSLGCESLGFPIQIIVLKSIIIPTYTQVCYGVSSITIPYSAHNTDQYRIDWNASSNSAGLLDVPLTNLTPNYIEIPNLPAASGLHTGTIYAKNNITNCEGSYPIEIYILPQIITTVDAILPVCSGTTTTNITIHFTGANDYWIDWDNNANAAGLVDIPSSLSNPNPNINTTVVISGIPTAEGTYLGTVFSRAIGSNISCSSTGVAISLRVNAVPNVTIGPVPPACLGTTNSYLPYSSATSSPVNYNINWSTTARWAGFVNVPLTSLPPTSIPLSFPSGSSGTFTGYLFISNANCTSQAKPFTVVISPTLSIVPTNPQVCIGTNQVSFGFYVVNGAPSHYKIDWDASAQSAGLANVPYSSFPPTLTGLPSIPGTYSGTVSVKNAGCESTPARFTLTINQSIINFPTIPIKTYGNPTFSLSASVTSALTISYSSSNTSVATISGNTVTIVGAGSTTITASQAGNSTFCPAISISRVLQVNKATLTATPTNASRTYGASNPTFGITYTGFVNGENASVIDSPPMGTSTATASSNNGTYPITLSGGTDNNYTFTYGAPATLTITKAALTATSTATKVYGAPNPAFPITYTGLMNGETAAVIDTQPTAASTATTLSNVGTYPITLTGGSDNNYNIINQVGSLSVTKKSLTATAANTSRYMGQANPTFTINYFGFVNGDNASVLDVRPVAATTAIPSSPLGTYPITVSGGTDNNYAYTYVNGVLTVLCDFYIAASGDLCTGPMTLSVTPTSGTPTSYLWSTGATTNQIIINGSGTYNATVTYPNGCTQIQSIYIENPSCGGGGGCPDPYNPNCPCFEGPCARVRGDAEEKPLEFGIFPNPADDELVVQLDNIAEVDNEVLLYSQTGAVASRNTLLKGESKLTVDTKPLTSGLYFVVINRYGIRKKVMVVH